MASFGKTSGLEWLLEETITFQDNFLTISTDSSIDMMPTEETIDKFANFSLSLNSIIMEFSFHTL